MEIAAHTGVIYERGASTFSMGWNGGIVDRNRQPFAENV
jgi:hypothetical protein